jgi:hypothetical protein
MKAINLAGIAPALATIAVDGFATIEISSFTKSTLIAVAGKDDLFVQVKLDTMPEGEKPSTLLGKSFKINLESGDVELIAAVKEPKAAKAEKAKPAPAAGRGSLARISNDQM